MSTPTDSPVPATASADRDPVEDVRAHLKQALAVLDRLRDVLPPPSSPPPRDARGGAA
ncbi:hypothetical protein [Nocardioides currus]|uniref:hypothetical protein n=1 Tax=Nocardioides currus TaxID=2133958 RepID=UPI001402DC95|nr:hypothetical protein [Nocardioides currus]